MRRKKPEGEDGYSYVCAICEDFGELLCCERCRQGFHLACVRLSSCPDGDSWLCADCSENKVRCFDCKEYGVFKETAYRCGVGLCGKIYHDRCVQQWGRPQPKGRSGIVCPHHYCDVCWNGQSNHPGKDRLYKCLRCPSAYHEVCIPDGAGLLEDIPGFMLCAKHNEGWKCPTDDNSLTEDVKVAFDRLPLPNVPQDFKLPLPLKVAVKRSLSRPAPYAHIRRNVYLVKRPRKKAEEENTQCSCHARGSTGVCDKDCLCGILLTSCSSSCKCGDACRNLPFQKRPGRKMKAVKTDHCGWGLKADEDIKAGDFLVEYVGEVIDDETCEKRLWAMKEQGESNFYMCEISREIVIDATFKGNLSRFINHSCSPNSELQKWEIEGEIRIGVFARQNIKKGEYVSYDYQFIQFGTDQMCHCGASGCRGQLGKPHKQKVVAENGRPHKQKVVAENGKPHKQKVVAENGKPHKQKVVAETPVKAAGREALLTRTARRSKLYGSFSIERGFTPINGVFRHQNNSFGEALKGGGLLVNVSVHKDAKRVVQADVHYEHKGEENCVGLRVRVWWPLDQKFYHGEIIRYDPKIGKHQIMYDDGQEEDLHMAKERWEFEKTKPSRPKRGRSPSLDDENDESHVVRLKGDPSSPAMDLMNGKTPVIRLRRAPSPALDTKSAELLVLEKRSGQSSSRMQRTGKSRMSEYKSRLSPILERCSSKGLPVEWRRTRSPMLRRTRSQPPVSKENSSSGSPALQDDGSKALSACEDDGGTKGNSNQSTTVLQGRGSDTLVPCDDDFRCKESSSESPVLQGDKSIRLIVCKDEIRCKENSSEPPVVQADRIITIMACDENCSDSLALKGNGRNNTLVVVCPENGSESPALEGGDRSKAFVVFKENHSESSALEGDRSSIVFKENGSEPPEVQADGTITLTACNRNSSDSLVLEEDRSNTLVACPENSSASPALEGDRSRALSALEGDRSGAPIVLKEKENGSEAPALEGDRSSAPIVCKTKEKENGSDSSALEGDRRSTLVLCEDETRQECCSLATDSKVDGD